MPYSYNITDLTTHVLKPVLCLTTQYNITHTDNPGTLTDRGPTIPSYYTQQ